MDEDGALTRLAARIESIAGRRRVPGAALLVLLRSRNTAVTGETNRLRMIRQGGWG